MYLDLLDFSIFSKLSTDPSRISRMIPPLCAGWINIDDKEYYDRINVLQFTETLKTLKSILQ